MHRLGLDDETLQNVHRDRRAAADQPREEHLVRGREERVAEAHRTLDVPEPSERARELEQQDAGHVVERHRGHERLDENAPRTRFLHQRHDRGGRGGDRHRRQKRGRLPRHVRNQQQRAEYENRRDGAFQDEQEGEAPAGVAQALQVQMGADGHRDQAEREVRQWLESVHRLGIEEPEHGADQHADQDLARNSR